MGDGRRMRDILIDIVKNTEIPYAQFIPTLINRNPYLFEEAIRYAKSSGNIDFTASSDPLFWEEREVKASKGLKKCFESGVPDDKITLSSDGQGSLPMFNEKKEYLGLRVGKVTSLFDEVRDAIIVENVPLDKALKTIASNPASILKLKGKDKIQAGLDADLVLLDG